MPDPNVFNRRKQQPKASSEALNLPIGQRLTRYRTGGDLSQDGVSLANPWKRHEARQQAKPGPEAEQAPTPSKTHGGIRETPELTAAREAEEARRSRSRRDVGQPIQPSLDLIAEDIQAILQVWIERHVVAGDFVATEHNAQNLVRCVEFNVRQRTPGWSWGTAAFEAAHKWLAENGYYEVASHLKKRGLAHFGEAAKVFPIYGEPLPVADNTLQEKFRTVVTVEENARLRKMPFEDLQAEVRKTYKGSRGQR